MDENFSAPPAIELNLNENINSPSPEPDSEEEHKNKEEQNNVTVGNNNEEKKDEQEEEEEEEEKDEIKRPWLKDFFYEIGTTRKVLQSIAVSLIYGFAIWGLILQIIDGVSYGLIDVGILIIFGTIMLIITIKKRSTGGCKMGILTIAVIFVGGAPTMVNFFFVESTRKLLPFFLTKSLALMLLITPLNFNE